MPDNVHMITLAVASRTPSKTLLSATYKGEIIARSINPECAAARVLKDRGLSGELRVRWDGAEHDSMRGGVEWFATKTVVEGRAQPRFVEFVPFTKESFEDASVE